MNMNHLFGRAALALALCGTLLGARPAAASQVLALDLGQLTQQSERVVVGEVISVRSAWNAKHERILTTVELRVAEAWKGPMPSGGVLTIVQPGGVAEGIEMRVHGMPVFNVGERAVFFLRGGANQPVAVTGMGQGKRGLRFDSASKRWMVDGGDRSAAVNLDLQGRTRPAGPEVPLPLDEMRRRVSTMVKGR
jgi:hypothetical protein